MKKRIFAIILAALMVVPFGVISASADTITVPSEPSVVAGTGTYYVDWNKKGATSGEEGDGTGIDAENPVQTKDWGKNGQFATYVQGGGTVSIVGKCYVNARATMPATATPLLFTSYAAINFADIDGVNAETGAATHGSQKGMVLVCNGQSITFEGDVIFDNTVLLDRGNANTLSTFSVGSTGKMVVNSNVTIASTKWNIAVDAEGNQPDHNPKLNVEEGGYAYLHTVGFSDYTGKGTIIIDKALIDSGKITTDAFANFTGVVADENGNVILNNYVEEEETTAPETTEKVEDTTDKAEETTKKADETTKKAEETTKKADETTKKADSTTAADTTKTDDADNNNAIVWIIVAVAAAAVVVVVVVVVVKKKKAE